MAPVTQLTPEQLRQLIEGAGLTRKGAGVKETSQGRLLVVTYQTAGGEMVETQASAVSSRGASEIVRVAHSSDLLPIIMRITGDNGRG